MKEVGVRWGMLMMRVMIGGGDIGAGTQLQLKRRAARRHEPDRDVGAK